MPPHGTRPNGAINREHHLPRSRERRFHRFVEFYSSPKACSKIFQPYLPLAEQDCIGQAFAASEQDLIAASEAPADLGDRLRELGPVLLFPKYRSDGLRELLATYVPDITLAGVWTERNRGIVTPSFQLSAVSPSGTRQWAVRLLNNLPNVAGCPTQGDRCYLGERRGAGVLPTPRAVSHAKRQCVRRWRSIC
jgi:hypothetical protein